jgi:hypothetical protein
MKSEEEKRIVQEKYKAKMKLLALKLYEDELAENARIAQIAERTVPPAYAERAFESAYDRIRREERKATLIRVVRRSATCAAALAFVIFATSALFGVRVDALIQKAIVLLFTETSTYDEITTVAGDADAIVDAGDWSGLFPAYIPEGYEFSSREVYAGFSLTLFTNGRQNRIRIEEAVKGSGNMMLDNEGGGHGKTTVHGETAFWTENEGGISLYWPRAEGSVTVFSDGETLETLVKIAESMKIRM